MNVLISSLVDFEGYHDEGDNYVTVENVIFKQDFGPWSKGDAVASLIFDYELGHIEECDAEGDGVKRCFVKLTADNDRCKKTNSDED